MLKFAPRIVMICLVVLVLYYVVTKPTEAAHDAHGWLDGLHSVASSLAKFVDSF